MANNICACFIHAEDHQGPVTFGDWDCIKKISDEIAHERKISGMAGKLELAFFHSNKSRWRVLSPASSLDHKKNACRARARCDVESLERSFEKRGHKSKARFNSAHVEMFRGAVALGLG